MLNFVGVGKTPSTSKVVTLSLLLLSTVAVVTTQLPSLQQQ